MIESERQKSALAALQHVLVLARGMAGSGASVADLEFVLEWAHVMPSYMYSPFDQTKDFVNALNALAERFADFSRAIKVFEHPEYLEATERRQIAAMARISATATR